MKTHVCTLLALILAAPAWAQDPAWNPLSFPSSAPRVSPSPPFRPVSPVSGSRRQSPVSPAYPTSPAARASAARAASRASGASPVRPASAESLPSAVRDVMQAYQRYLSALHAPNSNPAMVQQQLSAYEQAVLAFNAGGGQAGGFSLTSADETPPVEESQGVLEPTRARVVLKRAGSGAFDIYTGEGGQAEMKAHAAKSFFAGLGYNLRYNIKENQRSTDDNKAWFARTSGDKGWKFFQPSGSRNDVINNLLLEFRIAGQGYDIHNASGQLYAKIRWETRTEGGADKVQRVYYYHGEGTDSVVASVVQDTINGAPALVVRQGAGETAVPKVNFVFQDWAAGPGGSSGGGFSFGRNRGNGAVSESELAAGGAFVDGFVIDSSVDKVGWRQAVGYLTSYDFWDD